MLHRVGTHPTVESRTPTGTKKEFLLQRGRLWGPEDATPLARHLARLAAGGVLLSGSWLRLCLRLCQPHTHIATAHTHQQTVTHHAAARPRAPHAPGTQTRHPRPAPGACQCSTSRRPSVAKLRVLVPALKVATAPVRRGGWHAASATPDRALFPEVDRVELRGEADDTVGGVAGLRYLSRLPPSLPYLQATYWTTDGHWLGLGLALGLGLKHLSAGVGV